MSIQSINEITKAEHHSAQMIADAKMQAQQMVLEAESEAALRIKQEKARAALVDASTIEKHEKSASEQIDSIKKDARETCAKIWEQAKPNMDEAVQIIVDRIVNV